MHAARSGDDPADACTSAARPQRASESTEDAGEARVGLWGRGAGQHHGWRGIAEGSARPCGRQGCPARASRRCVALKRQWERRRRRAWLRCGRAPPRFALPREPASPAGDEAGKRLRGAQHKGLSPGATAAAAATAPTSLEPPVEAEPAPGPSSPPVPSGGHYPCPRDPGTRAPSPLLPRLPGDQTAAQPPPLQTVGALRSMSEDSDMEKAIKVRLHMMCATHPNIVQIIEVFANSVQFPHESSPRARLLIVMEMMEGGELFHRISQHRHFTEKQASQVTKQATLALQHCHLLNIAHRDLKPENLLFKDNSLDAPVKLCDFGFAKVDQGDLMTPQFTPYYVAPQVLEAQRRHQKEKSGIIPTSPTPYTYNKSCDLWSLGVIIYVMLCGYPPFYSKHHSRTIPKDMRRKIMTGSFEFPEEEWSQISEMAKDVVRKLLKVKPEERLTIEGVLDHPWLNSTEALDNVLPSAQLMMDKAVVAGIQQAHAEQLANMRIQDLKVSLKPLHSVNNPILRKRKLLGTKPKDGIYIHDHENGAEDSNVALEKLRDVIAQCILPQAGENEDERLNEVMQEAWKYNRDCKLLRDALQSFSWNGSVYYSSYETVIPKRLPVKGSEDPGGRVSYMLLMQGRQQLLHLEVKGDHSTSNFPVYSYHNGVLGQEMPLLSQDCHYEGYMEGVPGSFVSVNICSGLRGILIKEETSYSIEPVLSSKEFEHIL
ncbi:MAP kinase-activated protein kinase 5 [Microtus ochrogaster]|uniref:non-specific serine/threonine protein kinase n=1 Tax=Microtus ochrogaster TaxID=79684 RepID=A0A8J6G0L5_MICOH|nr:MAP kinase-activated protein kinase 5 [Microtus ochrogaster]